MPTFQELLAEKTETLQQQAKREAVTAYLQSLKSSGLTLGAVVDELQKAGAWDQAKDIAIADVLALFQTASVVKRGGGRQRLSGPEKAALVERVVAHVKANPWSGSRQIASAVNAPSLQVSRLLKEMVGKQIKKQGAKAATVYAVAGEKSKPKG